MPTVNVASPLRSYTQGAQSVAAKGATVAQVLADLERRYPGMRFRMIDEQGRIRQHIRIFDTAPQFLFVGNIERFHGREVAQNGLFFVQRSMLKVGNYDSRRTDHMLLLIVGKGPV